VQLAHEFFDLQLQVAEKISQITGQPIQDTITNYTAFYLWFDLGSGLEPFDWNHPAWRRYIDGIPETHNISEWTYASYLLNHREPLSHTSHKFWGCFSYGDHKGDREIIRIHFRHHDDSGQGPLSSQRKATRIRELTDMFMDIRTTTPEAKLVRGESWLYNRKEYKRLFPPAYGESAQPVESDFKYRAIWGQFLKSNGGVQADLASTLMNHLADLRDVQDLGKCFPYQILRTECDVADFYRFYGIEGSH
jgi:hypothetical protein